jgi:hypothetical protein
VRHFLLASCAMALAAIIPGSKDNVKASSDGGCYPTWIVESGSHGCESSAIISPGNDSRVNLLLLLRDRVSDNMRSYPKQDDSSFGRNFFDWYSIGQTFYHVIRTEEEEQPEAPAFLRTQCHSLRDATQSFKAALETEKTLSANERNDLSTQRDKLLDICKAVDAKNDRYPIVKADSEQAAVPIFSGDALKSGAAKEFIAYLNAAAFFYNDDFIRAIKAFTPLLKSKNPWVREASLYMLGRAALNQAQLPGIDKWGSFDLQKADRETAASAEEMLLAYLKLFPKGQYAASAKGLIRRSLWLSANKERLGNEYESLLQNVNVNDAAAAYLAEEIDIKFLFDDGSATDAIGNKNPILLAAIDLILMRAEEQRSSGDKPRQRLTREQLESQKVYFAKYPKLFNFLQANYAYYVEDDAKAVLQLIPDEARQSNFGYLDFSRQALRGLALAKLNDANAVAFWKSLLSGSKAVFQRPAIELALAIYYEKQGQIEAAFAAGSPIKETQIRKQLLEYSSGPDLLRTVAQDRARPRDEREIALFSLLHKNLLYKKYADFVSDVKLVSSDASNDAYLWRLAENSSIPVGLFTKGKTADDYPCAPLAKSIAALAKNPKDAPALLCLGDFWRLNGFDDYGKWPGKPKHGLGSVKDGFSGTTLNRQFIYNSIIYDKAAGPNERAYALYRAVWCYAPSGYNSCGGKDADIAQRKLWFQQLKREYPKSKWAEQLRYYW